MLQFAGRAIIWTTLFQLNELRATKSGGEIYHLCAETMEEKIGMNLPNI